MKKPLVHITTWLLLSLIVVTIGWHIGTETIIPGPSAPQTLNSNPGERIATANQIPPKDILYLTLSHSELSVDDVIFKQAAEDLISQLKGSHDFSIDKLSTLGRSFFDDKFKSEDQRSQLIVAELSTLLQNSTIETVNLPALLDRWRANYPHFELHYLSQGTINNEMFSIINQDLDTSLYLTIPLTLAILFWAFRSITVSLIPLIIATVSLFSSLGISAVLSHLIEPISATSAQLVVLLVLAIGVDYSLFIISRIREECYRGESFDVALSIAMNSTGKAVLWSGLTVALSLLGLLMMNDSILTSMALVSIVAVLVTVANTLYVLPHILLLIGAKKVVPVRQPRVTRVSSFVTISAKYPKATLLSSLLFLSVFTYFAFKLELGTTIEPAIFPKSMQSRAAITRMQEKFPDLNGVDLSIILNSSDNSQLPDTDIILEVLDELELENLRGPIKVERSPSDMALRLVYLAIGSANAPQNHLIVKELRERTFPLLREQLGIHGNLSGTLQFVVDEMDRYRANTWRVFSIVLLLCFSLLLLIFRSIVIPIKAIVLNIVSTSFAFGFIALIFEFELISNWNFGVIEGFVPALLYSILFGLSMDYHVLMISRIQEFYRRGIPTKAAVEDAILSTGRSITSAAAIMIAVFSIIATLELPIMKELGVGLAAAVAIDATVIRLLILPASMILLDELNWYLPPWLKWLPRIDHKV